MKNKFQRFRRRYRLSLVVCSLNHLQWIAVFMGLPWAAAIIYMAL